MKKITPFLWFNDNAEQAMNFYLSVFRNAKAGNIARYGESGPGKPGSVMTVTFTLEGQEFFCLNGGPHFTINEAISFYVNCEDQQEIDEYWEKLTADGGKAIECGWLTDKFGVTWQIAPARLQELLLDPDPEKAGRVMQAMLQMKKLDIATLERAYEGE